MTTPRRVAAQTPKAIPAYGLFFLLAGLEAVFVVAFWPLALLAGNGSPIEASYLGAWHAAELIYGYVPAVLAGFILTALPRWTGKALVPPAPLLSLAALWVAGRVSGLATLMGGLERCAWIGCLFPIALALLIGRYVIAAQSRRNAIVVILLALIAFGAGVEFIGTQPSADAHLGERIGLAATLGLVMVLGGRITPALTDTVLATRGSDLRCARRRPIESAAAALATAAFACWVFAPGWPVTTVLCGAAAIAQGLRLTQWRGLSVIGIPNVFSFHAAYACLPLGFALTALASFHSPAIPAQAGMHAWTMGAIALMCLAVMTSMVRRQTGHPFEISAAANAAFLLAGTATLCRIGAAFATPVAKALLTAAAFSWLAAFGFFLAFLYARLLRAGRPASSCAASCQRTVGAENGCGDCR